MKDFWQKKADLEAEILAARRTLEGKVKARAALLREEIQELKEKHTDPDTTDWKYVLEELKLEAERDQKVIVESSRAERMVQVLNYELSSPAWDL